MPVAPIRRRCLSLVFLAVLSACSDLPREPQGAQILATHIAPDYNGVVLLRHERNGTPLVRAYGSAQFGAPAPGAAPALSADTRFMVGSVSKWITAVTVLRLVDQGKLDLDAPVTAWLPELPAASRAVTLRHLLSNTSGIENGLNLAMKRDRSPERMTISPLDGALRFGSGGLRFAPGTQFDYSSTNWLLVAGVVERATGEAFTETVARLVFAPAGVRDTGFMDLQPAPPRMALAYDSARMVPKVVPSPPMAAAAGTIYSTARDLLRIADTVYGGDLLLPASRAELLKVQYAPEEYALGGRVKQVARQAGTGTRSRTLAWESGVSGGYKTLLAYSPADGRAVVLLNNTDMAQSEQARIALALLDAMDR
jgi:D-alanyl-D-alanine carboxypeptidase